MAGAVPRSAGARAKVGISSSPPEQVFEKNVRRRGRRRSLGQIQRVVWVGTWKRARSVPIMTFVDAAEGPKKTRFEIDAMAKEPCATSRMGAQRWKVQTNRAGGP